jgi:hypothetical protein
MRAPSACSCLAATIAFGLLMAPTFRVAGQPPESERTHVKRRMAALQALGSRLLIVPSAASFKSDDQAGFQQTSDFQYLTDLDYLVGAVLALDGAAKVSILFIPGQIRLSTVRSRPWIRSRPNDWSSTPCSRSTRSGRGSAAGCRRGAKSSSRRLIFGAPSRGHHQWRTL